MRPAWAAVACAACLAAAGCLSTGSTYGSTTGARSATSHGAATAASGAGATSGTTTATASTSGGSGSTTGSSCPQPVPDAGLDDCGAGQVELRAQLIDAFESQPLEIPIQFTDLNDPGITSQNNGCGEVIYCVPPGTILAPDLLATGYEPTILDNIKLDYSIGHEEFPLFQAAALSSLLQSLIPAFNPNQAVIGVRILNVQGDDACTTDGWSFTAFGPDGGAVAAVQADLRGSSIAVASSTDNRGVAFLYDIDPGIGQVTVVGVQDGGIDCPYEGQVDEYEQTVRLQAGTLSVVIYEIGYPDAGGSPDGG